MPMQLYLVSLAACLGSTLRYLARRARQNYCGYQRGGARHAAGQAAQKLRRY